MLLSTLEKRASPENPSTSLSNPAAWFVDWTTGGGKTKAGVSVNNSNALGISAVYAAVRRISDDVAKLPLEVFEKLPRGREKATEHHLYDVLKTRPNPIMNSFTFWEVLMGHVLTWGNAYAEIVRDGAGRVRELWPLRPDRMDVKWTGTRKVYLYRKENGGPVPFTADEILHIPGFGYDGLIGYNPIRLARESLGLTKAAEMYGASFFGNSSRPAGVLSTDQIMKDESFERVRKSWEETHRGSGNHHKVAILEAGLSWTQIGLAPEEAQFLESRNFQTREVARWFQIAPHKLGDLADAHFNNVEQFDQAHLGDTIQPWVERIERIINWELFPERDRGTFYAKFLIQALLRPDSQARAEYLTRKFQAGAVSPNDWRELDEQNPIEGGDQYFVPLNMVPLDMADAVMESGDPGPAPDETSRALPEATGAPAPKPAKEPIALTQRNRFGEETRVALTQAQSRSVAVRQRLVNAHKDLFKDTAQRVLNRELIQARRAVGKAFGGRDAVEFRIWLDEFYSTHNEFVAEQFMPVLLAYSKAVYQAAAEEVGGDEEMSEADERFVREYADVYGVQWAASSRQQLQAILRDTEPDEVEAALTERLDGWEETRAEKEAARETVRAGSAVTKIAYIAAGITALRWVTVGTSCPYCQKMNGRTVSIQGAFLQEGDEVDPEVEGENPLQVRSTIGGPPLHRFCDCNVVAG